MVRRLYFSCTFDFFEGRKSSKMVLSKMVPFCRSYYILIFGRLQVPHIPCTGRRRGAENGVGSGFDARRRGSRGTWGGESTKSNGFRRCPNAKTQKSNFFGSRFQKTGIGEKTRALAENGRTMSGIPDRFRKTLLRPNSVENCVKYVNSGGFLWTGVSKYDIIL